MQCTLCIFGSFMNFLWKSSSSSYKKILTRFSFLKAWRRYEEHNYVLQSLSVDESGWLPVISLVSLQSHYLLVGQTSGVRKKISRSVMFTDMWSHMSQSQVSVFKLFTILPWCWTHRELQTLISHWANLKTWSPPVFIIWKLFAELCKRIRFLLAEDVERCA